jgi:PAS domain S-box-containing protein
MADSPYSRTREQLEALLHELQIQHIELQVQNRELLDAQQLVEESRSRYADLYDFAPIGYCTVDPEGHVKEANLTAARLFALRRNQLIGRQLTSLVEPQDRRALQLHLERVRGTAEPVTSEVSFTTRTGPNRGPAVRGAAGQRQAP